MRAFATPYARKTSEVQGRRVGPVEILQRDDDRILRAQPLEHEEDLLKEPEPRVGPLRGRRLRGLQAPPAPARAAAARAAVPRARQAPANRRSTAERPQRARTAAPTPRTGCSGPPRRWPHGCAPAGRARRRSATSRSRRGRKDRASVSSPRGVERRLELRELVATARRSRATRRRRPRRSRIPAGGRRRRRCGAARGSGSWLRILQLQRFSTADGSMPSWTSSVHLNRSYASSASA